MTLAASDRDLLLDVIAVHAAYCHAIDRCDPQGWAAAFHEDGVSEGPGREPLRGRRAIRSYLETYPRPDLVHLTLGSMIERVVGETVIVAARFVILSLHAHGVEVAMTGTYADELERDPSGRLLIKHRRATLAAAK